MRRREMLAAAGLGATAVLRGRPERRASTADLRFVERWSWAMGQSVHIQLFADDEDRGYEAAAAALAEIRRIEARLTLFDSASDLSELNRLAGRRPMRADTDLAAVLGLAERFRRVTLGAFDPAVEPLMRAWGFREPRISPPSARELAEARGAVRAAQVRLAQGRAFLPSAHTQLDFGGIGVGYALDRAGSILRARGIERALLDISGDLLAIGAPPGVPGWRVGVAAPDDVGMLYERCLNDVGLATSSNRQSTRRYGGHVVGHVFDPATGESVPSTRQVTVIAASASAADALATAALVCGHAPGAHEVLITNAPRVMKGTSCRKPV